jgi:hypothetical protein
MKPLFPALAGLALTFAGAARAEVIDAQPNGFESRFSVTVDAPPAAVRAAMVKIGDWWDPSHTYSGDAKNLTLDLSGGCFCETLKTGLVRHMTVVYADANAVRLQGALGPLQTTGASGHLSFVFKPAADGKTTLNVSYAVGGYAKGGLGEIWAKPVDGVLAVQVGRLKAYAETGRPG